MKLDLHLYLVFLLSWRSWFTTKMIQPSSLILINRPHDLVLFVSP